jgi:hypothetical protein
MGMSRVILETWIPQSRLGPKFDAQGVRLKKVALSKSPKVAIAKKQSMDERLCVVLPQDFYD